MSSDPPLNAMPRMPTVMSDRSSASSQLADDVEREALVDEHGRVAERELVVAERGQLHGVLEQARASREAGAGHVLRARVVLREPGADALEVEARRFAIM